MDSRTPVYRYLASSDSRGGQGGPMILHLCFLFLTVLGLHRCVQTSLVAGLVAPRTQHLSSPTRDPCIGRRGDSRDPDPCHLLVSRI